MPSNAPIVVLKFGSSVLRSETDLPTAVHEIYRWWKQGNQVVAVVSAFGNTTDELTRRARAVCERPGDALVAALLATGEAASSALLGLALNRAGIPANVLDAEQAGFCTQGSTLDADLVSVDVVNVLKGLQNGVVVLPGFVGRNENGQTTLLGRGGSDLTALFLAQQLGGTCRLIKDVDGLYTSDPNSRGGHPAYRFARISYRTARSVGGEVVQQKTIDFAEKHRLRLLVSSVGSENATEIGPYADRIEVTDSVCNPLRVVILGCGTVGGGVYQRLAQLPQLFKVVGVGTRNIERAIQEDIPVHLLTTRLEKLIEEPADVVIELIGGLEPARTLVTRAITLGRHVVTANKALLSTHLNELQDLANKQGVSLLYSASVGGVTPAFEAIKRARLSDSLTCVSGILNGTTNFILDELSKGSTYETAIKLAQQFGYAEADPTLDLNGSDAAQKLILLVRDAFDFDLPFESIDRKGIDGIDETIANSLKGNRSVRLVAECRRTAAGFDASVRPVEIESHHPFARTNGAGNCLVIETTNEKTWAVTGQGAGRWPTTEAVIGDLFDLRSLDSSVEEEKERVA